MISHWLRPKNFFNHTISSFFYQEGIIHKSSCVYAPQENSMIECKNDYLFTTTRVFLFQNHVAKQYWGETILTSTWFINCLPSSALEFKIPLKTISKFHLEISVTNHSVPWIFRCVIYAHIHSHHRGNFNLKFYYVCLLDTSIKRSISVTICLHKKLCDCRCHICCRRLIFFLILSLRGAYIWRKKTEFFTLLLLPYSTISTRKPTKTTREPTHSRNYTWLQIH